MIITTIDTFFYSDHNTEQRHTTNSDSDEEEDIQVLAATGWLSLRDLILFVMIIQIT